MRLKQITVVFRQMQGRGLKHAVLGTSIGGQQSQVDDSPVVLWADGILFTHVSQFSEARLSQQPEGVGFGQTRCVILRRERSHVDVGET
jgi:hypothetical protein